MAAKFVVRTPEAETVNEDELQRTLSELRTATAAMAATLAELSETYAAMTAVLDDLRVVDDATATD